MTTLTQIRDAYTALLRGSAPIAHPGEADDAFELYTFALVLRAAREEGAAIAFQSRLGVENPAPMTFRTSPGSIYSSSDDYTHATVIFPAGLSLEVHIGVFVEGAARVLHECDVLVVDSEEATFCRNNGVHPKRGSAVLTVECKFYSSKLGIALGREFLGVTTDLGSQGRFFLSNSDGPSVERVLAHHNRLGLFRLSPLRGDTEGQAVALFRTRFRNQVARYR